MPRRLLRVVVVAALVIMGCVVAAGVYALVVTSSYGPPVAGVPKATPRPPARVAGLGSGWKLSFDASFTGSRLNTSVWGTCYPWQSPAGCTNFGNANEYEWYTPSQDQVYGGALHLVPKREPTPGRARDGAPVRYAYRSGMVTTFPGFRFRYGYVQVIARIPYGNGLWPALWMLPVNEQWPPEIDILEHYGDWPVSLQHLHSPGLPAQMGFELTPDLSSGWHVFGLYWSQDKIIWYIDGKRVYQTTRGIPRLPMYFLADLAVYQKGQQSWNPVTDSMAIKSVRVWEARSYP